MAWVGASQPSRSLHAPNAPLPPCRGSSDASPCLLAGDAAAATSAWMWSPVPPPAALRAGAGESPALPAMDTEPEPEPHMMEDEEDESVGSQATSTQAHASSPKRPRSSDEMPSPHAAVKRWRSPAGASSSGIQGESQQSLPSPMVIGSSDVRAPVDDAMWRLASSMVVTVFELTMQGPLFPRSEDAAERGRSCQSVDACRRRTSRAARRIGTRCCARFTMRSTPRSTSDFACCMRGCRPSRMIGRRGRGASAVCGRALARRQNDTYSTARSIY